MIKQTLFLLLILTLPLSLECYSQLKKLSSKDKREIAEEKRIIAVEQMGESKNFSFTVRSVDDPGFKEMYYEDLRGVYMIKITPQELTVYLPFLGFSPIIGMSPGYNNLSFATDNYLIDTDNHPEIGVRIRIKAADYKSGYEYVFTIIDYEGTSRLTVYSVLLPHITFSGNLKAGHK